MSTAARGMDGVLSIGGTAIGLLTGVDFAWDKPVTEFAAMGTSYVTQVLHGVRHYHGAFRKAFVDCTYHTIFQDETVLVGSLVARSGRSFVGSLVITGGSLENLDAEESAAVIEEGTFVMYNVTCS